MAKAKAKVDERQVTIPGLDDLIAVGSVLVQLDLFARVVFVPDTGAAVETETKTNNTEA